MSHNREVLATNIYQYVPQSADYVVSFGKQYLFDEYFALDSTNRSLIIELSDHITYPLLIVKYESDENLILYRVTKDQEKQVKNILENQIAPYHLPQRRVENDLDIYFYPLPENKFLIATFKNGVMALSTNYIRIEDFTRNNLLTENFIKSEKQAVRYVKNNNENFPIRFFITSGNTFFALSYVYTKDYINFEGKYFGQLEKDSIKLSYNEINHLLRLKNHYTDSVVWEEDSRLRILVNNAE